LVCCTVAASFFDGRYRTRRRSFGIVRSWASKRDRHIRFGFPVDGQAWVPAARMGTTHCNYHTNAHSLLAPRRHLATTTKPRKRSLGPSSRAKGGHASHTRTCRLQLSEITRSAIIDTCYSASCRLFVRRSGLIRPWLPAVKRRLCFAGSGLPSCVVFFLQTRPCSCFSCYFPRKLRLPP
jgi:hypothetical protein